MDQSNSTMAQQIAQAARAFERQRTGHGRQWLAVFLSEDTLVITLHGSLSPAEKALARSPAGAAQVQQFHRELFAHASQSLRQEIKRITGMEVREATAEVETTTGTIVQAFTTGTVVQEFLLAGSTLAASASRRTDDEERTFLHEREGAVKPVNREFEVRFEQSRKQPQGLRTCGSAG